MFNCKFSRCGVKLAPEQAWVPAIPAIRKAVGKPVTEEELANHTFCGRHARAMRDGGMKMFSYISTVAELRHRAEDKAAAKGLFNLYGAFEKAGLAPKPAKSNQKKRTPKPAAVKPAVLPAQADGASAPVKADST